MADPGPSSGRQPLIRPPTSAFGSPRPASSSTQLDDIVALASTNDLAQALGFNGIQVTNPSIKANGVLSARIDTRIKLSVFFGLDSPVKFLKIPKTPSVHRDCPTPEGSLKFLLELKGAGSGNIIGNICENCKKRKDQATWDMVDFRAPTTIVTIENGTASIEFFIKCYAHHHGAEHFHADAILRDYQDNVIRTQLPCLFSISGKGNQTTKTKKAQRRAVRGVSAQQHSILPAVPPSIPPSAQDSQHVENGTAQEWVPFPLEILAGDNRQPSNGNQQPFWDTTATLHWDFASIPVNAPPLVTVTSQHAPQSSELVSNPHIMGSLHPAGFLPLESNSSPVVYPSTRIGVLPNGEQIPPVTPCENPSVPHPIGHISGEPPCEPSINQSSRVPEATPRMLSQNSSGTSQGHNTSSGMPSGQGPSAPDISTPPESSRLQAEPPVPARSEGIDQIRGETLLERAVPQTGPMIGGIEINLWGQNFPDVLLYVRFGDNCARAIRHDARILRCSLPPSARPGLVNVTLSQTPSKDAPEVGGSVATFTYEECRLEPLLSSLKAIHQLGEAPRQMGFATHSNPSLNTRATHLDNREREEIPTRLEEVDLEDISVHFLSTYSTHPDWKQIVSTCNSSGQTLAHISIALGYFRLLQHLFEWQIDLTLVDSMGLTALHYAYLFQQEECAKFLIHSGVDQFILDDLGRSPSDLNPSLEVKLRSIMDMDIDSDSADGASPNQYDTEVPDEARKLYAKDFLIQQWMQRGEDERRGEVPQSRCQSQENMGATYDRSSSLAVRTPEERPKPTVAEEIDLGALIEIATPPHIIYPPSPISEVSPQTQEANRISDTGQNLFPHPAPLSGAINTPDLKDAQIYRRGKRAFHPRAHREPSLVPTATRPLLPNAPKDIKEYKDTNGGKWLQLFAPYARPSASPQRSMPGSSMEPADTVALDNAGEGVEQFSRDHPYTIEPPVGDPAPTDGTAGQHAYAAGSPGAPSSQYLAEVHMPLDASNQIYWLPANNPFGVIAHAGIGRPTTGAEGVNGGAITVPIYPLNEPFTTYLVADGMWSVPVPMSGNGFGFTSGHPQRAISQDGGNTEKEATAGAYDGRPQHAASGALANTPNHALRTATGRWRRRPAPVEPEGNLERLKHRLAQNGADARAVILCGEIFRDGVSIEALQQRLTLEQCRELHLRYGKQYQRLLEVTGWTTHRCRLCPENDVMLFKNYRDALRHFLRDHFGLSFECTSCDYRAFTRPELNRHVRAAHDGISDRKKCWSNPTDSGQED